MARLRRWRSAVDREQAEETGEHGSRVSHREAGDKPTALLWPDKAATCVSRPARWSIDRIVLDDEAPPPGELQLLAVALDTLAVLFRIWKR